jgi:endonuclease IV
LLSHPVIRDLPLILETPVDKERGHEENIEMVKRLASG